MQKSPNLTEVEAKIAELNGLILKHGTDLQKSAGLRDDLRYWEQVHKDMLTDIGNKDIQKLENN